MEKQADDLRAIVSSKAGMTLKEMRDALHARGIVVKALSTISDMLHRPKLSYKKSLKSRRAGSARRWPGIAAAGRCGSASWSRPASCSWTRAAVPRTISGAGAGGPKGEGLVTHLHPTNRR